MLEAMISGLLDVFALNTLLVLLIGIPIGLIFGILPGLGGLTALAVLMPLIYGMKPSLALAFLLAAHAVIYTGGSVTAVLLNIPGAPPNAATLIDGFPMTQKGLAGRALGNALASSGLGGLVGGVLLIGLIFVVRPIVMAFGLPEYFFLIVLGISFIAVLGRGSSLKGLISGIMGIFLSFIGVHALTGEPRFWFGSLYLLEGIEIIPLVLGLFAMPEVVDLIARRGTIAQVEKVSVSPGLVWEGVKDVFRHWGLFLQSSALGAIIGIIPGIGGDAACFIAYGMAKQVSRIPEQFGQGCVEGVIAPESANNAKEGGSLLPTLAFGIPGSSAMALLLGAFLIVGLRPGPLFLEENLDVAFTLAGTVIFANILGAAALLLLAPKLANLAFIRGSILGPVVLVLVVIGGYLGTNNLLDVVMVFVFGALGYVMKSYRYNRPALFLGFVLGALGERYFGLALKTYGPFFFLRPISLILFLGTILVLFSDVIRESYGRRKRA
jgi:putative tricarboxylic transport membrane protein